MLLNIYSKFVQIKVVILSELCIPYYLKSAHGKTFWELINTNMNFM
jgi:hypothetical protein